MSKLETNTIDNISGSSTLTIGDSNTSTIALKSGATLTNFPDNTPAFQVTKSTAQTVSHATTTKVTWDTETFDTDSAFASNKFTVPSGEGGKYLFNVHLQVTRGVDSDTYRVYTMFYKNGSQVNLINLNLSGTSGRVLNAGGSQILDLAASDYVEIYVNAATSSSNSLTVAGGSTETAFFNGFKILGA